MVARREETSVVRSAEACLNAPADGVTVRQQIVEKVFDGFARQRMMAKWKR